MFGANDWIGDPAVSDILRNDINHDRHHDGELLVIFQIEILQS